MSYELSHLRELEAESIHIMREVAAEFENPALMFSGGKDSIVMLRLAEKAFAPAKIPYPMLHVDTGHNFKEVIDFRDKRAADLGVRLIVASVQDTIDAGRVTEETGARASRNRLQTTTLLEAIEEHRFDALFGGARRDEEKSRAKERVYSGEEPYEELVRYRTVGDITITGAVESDADTIEKIIDEVAATRQTERGATRADDRVSEAAMEDRKKEGYF